MELIRLAPVFQEKIWGGQKISTLFNFDQLGDHIGEAWVISAHAHGRSQLLNTPYQGKYLDEVWQLAPDLFGNPESEQFPLLVKLLDASDDLSVQVHPDDAYALAYEGELGKTECWYVLAAEEDAKIVYGHHAQSQTELDQMIRQGQWEDLLRWVPVKAGDFYYVPSGTLHAIGRGIVILEIQQSSDTTYRVYDYDRKDHQGHLRDLHIQSSLEVIQVPFKMPLHHSELNRTIQPVQVLLDSDKFTVEKWCCQESLKVSLKGPYTLCVVIEGEGCLEFDHQKEKLTKGDSFIIPHGISQVEISQSVMIIASYVA